MESYGIKKTIKTSFKDFLNENFNSYVKWGVSEKNIEILISILIKGDELDPIILNNGKFFDGGHRLTAYKRLRIDKIPTIDIGFMLNFDYEKWENGKLNF